MFARPAAWLRARRWRTVVRHVVAATILTAVPGCDKANKIVAKARELAGAVGQREEKAVGPQLDLSRSPTILFQVFGERDDPRMFPLAAVINGQLQPIVLSSQGWRTFDERFGRSGATYPLFNRGRRIGTLEVRQGMWERPDAPLYSLPSCRRLIPLIAARIGPGVKSSFTVEFLASNGDLGAPGRGTPKMPARKVDSTGRALSRAAASAAGIGAAALDQLDSRALALETGASAGPTIMVSLLDARMDGGGSEQATTTHLLVLGDRKADGSYAPSFVHAVNGPAATAEFRRFVDHLDITGDGIDEMVLEGWQHDGASFLSILGFSAGRWRELHRAGARWCLD